MILIIGSEGSMGTRYKSILNWIGVEYICSDIGDYKEKFAQKVDSSSKIILCTPTDTHHKILQEIIPTGKTILCEKPISKSLFELSDILNLCDKYRCNFNMTFQYSELVKNTAELPSFYNYFRTGKDGLFWDCLQIIALAKTSVDIRNTSPIWSCFINGQELYLSDMDEAYVSFIKKWINGEINQDHNDLFKIHEKTERLANGRN